MVLAAGGRRPDTVQQHPEDPVVWWVVITVGVPCDRTVTVRDITLVQGVGPDRQCADGILIRAQVVIRAYQAELDAEPVWNLLVRLSAAGTRVDSHVGAAATGPQGCGLGGCQPVRVTDLYDQVLESGGVLTKLALSPQRVILGSVKIERGSIEVGAGTGHVVTPYRRPTEGRSAAAGRAAALGCVDV